MDSLARASGGGLARGRRPFLTEIPGELRKAQGSESDVNYFHHFEHFSRSDWWLLLGCTLPQDRRPPLPRSPPHDSPEGMSLWRHPGSEPSAGQRRRRGVFNVSNPVYLLKTDRQLETMNPTGSWFLFFFWPPF